MNAVSVKLTVSAVVLVLVTASLPFLSFSAPPVQQKEGVMIDYGSYSVDWVETSFDDGMTGVEALEAACGIEGYGLEKDSAGNIVSVNGKANLIGMTWGMYVLRDSVWTAVDNPSSFTLENETIISWARVSSEDGIMPGTDATGNMYYSYGSEGLNRNGERLRIATLSPSVTETLAAVGCAEYIIATDMYSDYPESIVEGQTDGSIQLVGGYTDPSFDLIISAAPDIVFLDGGVGDHLMVAKKLRKAGIDCVVLYDIENVYDVLWNIWIAASAMGFSERGCDAIEGTRETISTVAGIADLSGKKVFVSLGTGSTPYTTGSGTYMDSMLEILGADNIFGDSYDWFMVDREQVYTRQPDIIIIIMDSETPVDSRSKYQQVVSGIDDLWKRTPAYENSAVYVFSEDAADLLSRPGPRLSSAMELLAKVMDSESFIEKDPWDRVLPYYSDDYRDRLTYQREGTFL